jgi:hypothetical protein
VHVYRRNACAATTNADAGSLADTLGAGVVLGLGVAALQPALTARPNRSVIILIWQAVRPGLRHRCRAALVTGPTPGVASSPAAHPRIVPDSTGRDSDPQPVALTIARAASIADVRCSAITAIRRLSSCQAAIVCSAVATT